MPSRYDASTKAKAVRLVREHRGDYPTEYAAITAVAGRLGMSAETLRLWIRRDEADSGQAAGSRRKSRRRSAILSGKCGSSRKP
jgi:transposase